jgi:hypothetical protein
MKDIKKLIVALKLTKNSHACKQSLKLRARK